MAGSYQVLARTHRPRTFSEVVGQEAVARTLVNAIERDRVAHAYMFCGPRGVGKTTMARLLGRALNCLAFDAPTATPCGECDLCVAASTGDDLDVFEMDAASNRKVDDARSLISNVSFHPARARFKVYIVDEVHMLTTEAFNALLKTLEEPPPHVKFILATTDPQKVPATILSRCQRFDFRPVPAVDIAATLARIAESEGVTAGEDVLIAIARAASGGMRDALSLLEQMVTLGGGEIRLDDLHALLGTVSSERMRELFDSVAAGDVAATLDRTAGLLDAGTDPGELLRQCMHHAHDLLLVKIQGPRAPGVVADRTAREALAAQAGQLSDATLAYAVTLLTEALKNTRLLGEGRLFAETALARLAGHGEMRFVDQLVRDLRRIEQRLDAGVGGGAAGSAAAPPAGRAPGGIRRPMGGAVADPPARPASAPESAPESHGGVSAPSAQASTAPRDPAPGHSSGPGNGGGASSDGGRAVAVQAARSLRSTPAPDTASAVQGSSSGAGASPEALVARWGEVRAAARAVSSRLGAHLEPARIEAAGAGGLIVSFPRSAAFHRRAIEEPEMHARLADAIETVGGARFVVRTAEHEDEVTAESAAPARVSRRDPLDDRLSAAELEAVRQAPLTKMIEGDLRGRIVHVERDA